jgi:hypothetical protein
MPQVPYSGVPDVGPEDAPLPRYSADTPVAAFGGATAHALTELGSSFGQVGNELYARADAMQQLKNHSDAQKATADYQEAAGKQHADFSALQGQDAVTAYPDYIASLKKTREDIGNGLSSPMAQKMYESESLNIQGRTIFNGAGHAASENKSYAIGAAAARVQSSRNASLVDPTDEKAFQQHLATTVSNTQAQWQMKGADQDTIDNATHKAVSDLYYDRIQGLARQQPFAASKMLDDATKDGKIQGEDVGRLTAIVRDAAHTVGARNISSEVNSGSDLSWGSKSVSLPQAKLAVGTYESGNNYQTLGPRVIGSDGTDRGQALGRYQVMPENLAPWLKQAGLPSMTQQEFLKSPSAQDKVFETVFGGYMDKYGSFNKATIAWFAGEGSVNKDPSTVSDKYHTGKDYLLATNRTLAQNGGLQDQIAMGRQKADAMSPNDPLMADYAESRIITDHNQTLAAKRDDDYKNRQTIEGALMGGQSGKLPTSVEDLKAAGPDVEAAWQKLVASSPSDARRYMGVMAKNAKGDTAWTQDNLVEYQRLKGMAQSNPAGFLDENVIESNLPMSARKELVNLQIAKKANAEADPRVLHALQILRPTMDQANITRKADADGYDKFVGALQSAMDTYASDNKKPADAKAVQEMGQRLLQTQAGTGYFHSNVGAQKLFEVAVPDNHRDAITKQVQEEKGIVPTDDMIQRIYTRQLYNDLYSKRAKAQQAQQ